MTTRTYTIGTRASRLALRQVELVRAALSAATPGIEIAVREIHTEGDRSMAPLSAIGGLGVFTKAVEDALLAGTIDIAVHSLKDLPTELAPGLTIGATPARADVRDVLVTRDGRTLDALDAGARIGTGAGRRAVQLRALRDDIEPAEIRGNVDTRIRKVDQSEYDGAVLAMAGLDRLSLTERAAQVFSIDEMLPAVGQGAMAIEVRADDTDAREVVERIEAQDTRAAVEAERSFLRRLGGGCRLPVGAYAAVEDGRLHLRGMIASANADAGSSAQIFRGEVRGPIADPETLGAELADELLAQGAQKFVDAR